MTTDVKIAVRRSHSFRTKKAWLTIGLIVFVLTMVCEFFLGNYAFLSLIVPFLYLLKQRKAMGNNTFFKDASISIVGTAIGSEIEIFNSEYVGNDLFSTKYSDIQNDSIRVQYQANEKKMMIRCVARKSLYQGDTVKSEPACKQHSIEFYTTQKTAGLIADELGFSAEVIMDRALK